MLSKRLAQVLEEEGLKKTKRHQRAAVAITPQWVTANRLSGNLSDSPWTQMR